MRCCWTHGENELWSQCFIETCITGQGSISYAVLSNYWDKPRTLWSASPFALYPIYIIILHLQGNTRQKQIVSSSFLVAYLPVGCTASDHGTRRKLKRSLQLENLHCFVNYVLEQLAKGTREGLLRKTSDYRYLLLHVMIASYVADISESENLSSVKRGSQTANLCYMREVKTDFISYSRAPKQCWKNVKRLVWKHI